MQQKELKKLLDSIPDHSMKKQIAEIMTGKIKARVKCNSRRCKGRIVANIYKDGKIKPTIDGNGVMYLLAYRPRLDGYNGFQCQCGNDSRLSEAEKGISGIENNSIQKSDIELVAEKLKIKPSKYKTINGVTEVDGFIIEELK